jgi:methionine sulfoxide reductase heme-binding subunit
MASGRARLSWLIPALITGWLVPFVWLGYRAATRALGANPIATALNQIGLLALVLLVASLCCTPLKLLFGLTWPMRIRRTLGLLGFFTALLHFLLYAVVDQGLALGTVVADVVKRPFIAFGFAALVLLVPLALTSTKRAVTRLGYARWKRLHQLVYLAVPLAVLHFFLRVKADTTQPLIYAGILGLLFGVRIVASVTKSRATLRHKAPVAGADG